MPRRSGCIAPRCRCCRGLPESRERDRQELLLLEGIAAPLNARFGYSSPELRATLERAVLLAESLGERESLVTGLVGLWTSQAVAGYIADAHRTAERALELVAPGSDLSGPAHFAFGGTALSLGRPDEAVDHFAQAAASGSTHSLSVGTRPDVHGRAFAAHAYWVLGDTDAARASGREAVDLARVNDTPYSLAVALAYNAITQQLCGAIDDMDESVAELRELCSRYGFAYYREWGLVLGGWSQGGASGLDLARRGIEALNTQGALLRMPYWLSLLSDLYERNGEPQRARADLDAATVGASPMTTCGGCPRSCADVRATTTTSTPSCVSRRRSGWRGNSTVKRWSVRCEADLAARTATTRATATTS